MAGEQQTLPRLAAPQFEPRWPNRKAVAVGFMAGQGYTAPQIAKMLRDGTTAGSINGMLKKTSIKRRRGSAVPLRVPAYELHLLQQRAAARGLSPDEWLSKVVRSAIRDDLFGAIVDE